MRVAVEQSALALVAGLVDDAAALVARTDVWPGALRITQGMPGGESADTVALLAAQVTEDLEALSAQLRLLASSLRSASSRYAAADGSTRRSFGLVGAGPRQGVP